MSKSSSCLFTIFLFVQMILRNSSLDGLFHKSHCVTKFFSPFVILDLSTISFNFCYVYALANFLYFKFASNLLFLLSNSKKFILDYCISLIRNSLWVVSSSTFSSICLWCCSNSCFYTWFSNWLFVSSNCFTKASFFLCSSTICVVIAQVLFPTFKAISLSWKTIEFNS